MDRLRALHVLARTTSLPLYEALAVVEALHKEFAPKRHGKADLSTFEGRVAFARTLPAVMDNIHAGKTIQAIKELRTATSLSLLEAKNAVDAIRLDLPAPF
jgi:ribosomal protein L7/L12